MDTGATAAQPSECATNGSPTIGGEAAREHHRSGTARQLIDLLEQQHAHVLLDQLARLKLAHKTESEFQFWQEGSKPKQVRTDRMLWQKLEYVHRNPQERGYVDDPTHWRYSSARNYAGQPGLIDVVTDWM
jgi:hypothetical protein